MTAMIELQLHPADVRGTAKFFFLRPRHVRLLLAGAAAVLVLLIAGLSLIPESLRGLWAGWQAARARREKAELLRERANLASREQEAIRKLEAASRELRRLALVTGYEGINEGELASPRNLELWSRYLSDEVEKLWHWAQKRAELLHSLPAICPLERDSFVVSSRFGPRVSPFTGALEFHKGLDLAAPEGQPVRATGKGTVVFAGRTGTDNPAWARLGNVVVLAHGESYYTVYAHLSVISVAEGQRVARGSIIGEVGNTGWSTAPHLHYEVRRSVGGELVPMDPAFFLLDYPMTGEELAMGGPGGDALDLLGSEREVLPWRKAKRYPR